MPEPEYGRRLRSWLEGFKFSEDPFAVWEADQERSVLPSLFVDRPYAVRLAGDPARPQSGFLLAGRGAGKTATREMVAHECSSGRIRRRALPVRYTDFTAVLERAGGNTGQVSLRDHAEAILRAGLRALVDEVPPAFFSAFDDQQRGLLQGLAICFADPLARMKLAQLAPGSAIEMPWEQFSPVELLDLLADLVTHLGTSERHRYEALYILVDRVDETAAGSAGALALLKPLAVEGALLGIPRVAFKFFLPQEIGEQLLVAAAVRRDRLIVESITWDEPSLVNLLEMRLIHYSNENIRQMEQLCAPDAKSSVARLWRECEGSPRNLLRMSEAMLRYHVMRTDKAYIEPKDVSAALKEFEDQQERERARPRVAGQRIEAESAHPASGQGLYLDESDHVWIDGQQLEQPLSDLEFRLLEALYRVAPDIVSQEDLISAVWRGIDPSQDDALYDKDEQNIRKLIGRIRKRLEPAAVPGAWRFVRNARGRGYWLNLS